MPNREKATATLPCPTCGASLAAQEQPDGGLAATTCSKCHPKTEVAAARADERLREQGTTVPGGE